MEERQENYISVNVSVDNLFVKAFIAGVGFTLGALTVSVAAWFLLVLFMMPR